MAFAKKGDSVQVVSQIKYVDPKGVSDKVRDQHDPQLKFLFQNYNTALHCAAYSGCKDTLLKILDRDSARIDEKNDVSSFSLKIFIFFHSFYQYGFTPIAVAASEGHPEIVSLLVQRGADPTLQDEVNCYPSLFILCSGGFQFGETPLHAAARAGDLSVVEALCQDCAPEPTYLNDVRHTRTIQYTAVHVMECTHFPFQEEMVAVDTAHVHGQYVVENFLEIKTPRSVVSSITVFVITLCISQESGVEDQINQ